MRLSSVFPPSTGLALASLLSLATAAHAGPADSAWIQLFNKADTNLRNNWDIKITGSALNVDNLKTFRYVISGTDTMIEVNYSNYTGTFNFGHMGYKIRPFSYYLLRGDYQVWGSQVAGNPGSWANQNNGFMLHSQSVASMTTNQDFPISLEAQLLGPANTSAGGGSVSASTMNLCSPGTGYSTTPTGPTSSTHCIPSKQGLARAAANTGWQKVSALILADSLHRYFAGPNGNDSALTYYKPVYLSGNVTNPPAGTPANGTRLTGGYITIQSESAPYRFRKIEVLNLEGCRTVGDVNYKSYLIKHDSTACGGVAGIKGHSASDARYAAPMTFIGNAIKVAGAGTVTLELFDMKGAFIARHTAQAPFQWSPVVKQSGMHVVRAITPKGTYSEKAALF